MNQHSNSVTFLPLFYFISAFLARILGRDRALKKLKGISSIPEVALFPLAGGEGRVESGGIIGPTGGRYI